MKNKYIQNTNRDENMNQKINLNNNSISKNEVKDVIVKIENKIHTYKQYQSK